MIESQSREFRLAKGVASLIQGSLSSHTVVGGICSIVNQ